jgi:CRISPR-associated helicase Cas3/CRISPR-associated endonuclease Cas3-HD
MQRWETMPSSSPELYSHRGRQETTLLTHLSEVMEGCAAGHEGRRRRLYEIIGATHDFGKANPLFQAYLNGERNKGRLTSHAPISGLACYYTLRAVGFEPEDRTIGLVAVERHHRGLKNVDGNNGMFSTLLTDRRQKTISEQASKIQERSDTVQRLYDQLDVPLDVADCLEWITSKQYLRDLFEETGYDATIDVKTETEGYRVIEAYANLIAADKFAASGYDLPARTSVPADAVDTYVETEFGSPSPDSIDELRETARQEVQTAIESMPLDEQLCELTLPTGAGKTLTGLMAALRLRARVAAAPERTDQPRIVYVVPFTAIIDQNFEEYRAVLDTCGITTDPSVLLKHHHRSDADYQTAVHAEGEPTDAEADRAMMLTERWESELIATTFVQLFESLLVPTNSQTLKFPNLQGSIILIDEVQSLPAKYWDVTRDVLETICERWGCRIIAMTATQPALFDDAYSLVSSADSSVTDTTEPPEAPPNKYFDALDRVQFQFDESLRPSETALTHPDLADRVLETATANPDADILIVCNTVDSSRRLFELLTEDSTLRETTYTYLSSAIRPVDRRQRIEQLRDADANERHLVVSTQVVEAGVDIDMDIVYRDFAPFDSIVQAAGRCNRNATGGQSGTVNVVRLRDADEETQPSGLIYDLPRLDATRSILDERGLVSGEASEATVTGPLVRTYFKQVRLAKKTDECRSALQDWKFEDASLSLIDDVMTADVLITRTDELAADGQYPPLSTIREALTGGPSDEVPTAKQAVYDRTVSVNIYTPESERAQRVAELPLPSTDLELYHITCNQQQYQDWYDEQTGFRLPDDTVSHRMI